MIGKALYLGACLAAIAQAQSDTAPPPGDLYGGNSLAVIQDSDIVAEAFPEVDIELLSPYFLDPERSRPGFANGTAGPTSLAELDYFVRTIADRNDWITYQSSEFKSEEGRTLPYVYLSEPSASNLAATTNSTKLKVYIQAAIHGNEPAADEGALALLGKMDANQTWAASLLEKMDILILPRWDADGVAYFQRRMACNLDPNREAAKLDRQQTRDIWRRAHEFAPHIMIDMHEYTASSTFTDSGDFQHAADAMLGIAADLNVNAAIREQGLDVFIPAMGEKLESNGLRWDYYVTGPANVTPPVFTEIGTGARFATNQHFQRRVATQLLKLEAVLETARDSDGLYDLIEGARDEFINSNEDIVITDASETINRTYPLVSRTDGSVVEVPVSFISQPTIANLTRTRPEAYLIPRTWSDIVAKLEILGLEVQTLDYEYRGTVESLTVANSSLATTIFEGHIPNTVTTETTQKEVQLPPGSFLVSTRQKNAALAFAVLEPENIDGYVTFNFIPLGVNDEYPIFRVMAE